MRLERDETVNLGFGPFPVLQAWDSVDVRRAPLEGPVPVQTGLQTCHGSSFQGLLLHSRDKGISYEAYKTYESEWRGTDMPPNYQRRRSGQWLVAALSQLPGIPSLAISLDGVEQLRGTA